MHGVLKNAIDHASQPYGKNAWQGKPAEHSAEFGLGQEPEKTAMTLLASRFLALLFAALALAPALAHLLELPNKMGLSRAEYETAQKLYKGWALLGVLVVAALITTAFLAVLVRSQPNQLGWVIAALVCIAGTQLVFWVWTFPVNQQTSNWTVLPESWMALRARWEYSHAASAVLNLVALVALICSVLVRER